MRRAAAFAAAVAATLALAACGLGAGATPTAVSLTVTRDFGAQPVRPSGPLKVVGQETVMSLLLRNYSVQTEYGGGFVQSIDGHAGDPSASPPVAWFYYVNGVEAPKGAAATNVYPGDRIWWDLHDWSAAESVPAVVGSFPQPFLSGIDGKRYPVRVECTESAQSACQTVAATLQRAGVPAALAGISQGAKPETLRVLVGPVGEIDFEGAVRALAEGPQTSGVYARLTGSSLTTLDESGTPVHKYGAGAGLIAATQQGNEPPLWIVTGTDPAGAALAARHFNAATLRDRFAVALTPQGPQALPVPN